MCTKLHTTLIMTQQYMHNSHNVNIMDVYNREYTYSIVVLGGGGGGGLGLRLLLLLW